MQILCELCILLACLMQVGSMNAECPAWSVACFDGDGCVSTTSFCDGQAQCRDRSDELLCSAKKADVLHCPGDKFVCWDGEECIPRTHLCDGAHDCSDGSDEHICEPHERCRREGLFLCANNQQCLNNSRLCDGKSDCWDGSDEQGKCEEAKTECNSNKCQHICEVSPEGAKCLCLPGYLTLQNRTCIDIDECKAKEPPMCSHLCQNFPGSYSCACHHGYKLTDDGRCLINGSLPIFLLANAGEIHGYEMFQNRSISSSVDAAHLYVEEHDKIKAMALGPNKVLYFSDIVHKKIYSSHLDGDWKAQGQEVINVGLRNPEGMDIDRSSGHLYIADSGRGEILACQENGDVCTAVVTHLTHPKALSIDQRNRHIYWSDAGKPRIIGRADLDGRGRIKFVRDHVGHVLAITVDYTTDRLYWVDILFHKLESIGLNGSHRKIILADDRLMGALSIALFEDRIYWTNPNHGVNSANKFTGRDVQEELSEIPSIASLIIMHPVLQNGEINDNSCSSADCSDMCLLTNGPGHRCACPEDKHLESNNRTCQIHLQVPRAYFGARKQIQQFPLLSVGYQDNLFGTVIEEKIEKIHSLDVSHKHGILVYSDIQRDVIARINISEDKGFSHEEIVYSKDLHSVEKLQLDAVTGNIYWVDVGKKTVEVASLSGEYHKVLISPSHFLQRLTSLAVAVMTGHLYLSLVGVSPTILSCTLDGISCLPLSVEVYHPNDLVLYEGRLYIADGDHKVVQILSVEVPDGGYRKVHWEGYDRDLTRMAIYDDVLYWTEDKGTSLFSVSLWNSQEETTVLHDIIPLSSIAIWNPKLTVVENACSRNNGGCSHLCLPVSQNSRVCACSDGFLLQKDNTSCIECKEPGCLCETYGNCSSIQTECDGLVCDVRQCIPLEVICDEVLDCQDGADEEKSRCDKPTITACGEGTFECDSGHCVMEHLVCNGQPDCADASDEGHLCEKACSDHHCDHKCVSMPYGSVCRCRQGYQVQNNGSCQDINECKADNGGCSQTCVNTEGSRLCQCSPDFISSNSSCIPPDPLPYLLFLEQGSITRYDSGNHGELVTISASESFVAFDVDISTGDIFGILSSDPKVLLRTNQNRQKADVLLRRSAKFTFVAYDWLGKNVYLSDLATPALIVCPLKHLNEGCLSLFHEETGSVVLHPLKGLMFWSYDDALQRSTMSGEKRGSVVDFESTMISSLSLDQFSGFLYWIDHYRGVIESCDMNGHNRKTILKEGDQMRFLSVAVFGDHLYFTEENTHSLYKYNHLTGSRHTLTMDLDFSLHIKVIHPIIQNPGPRSDVCHKRSCSHLCLVTPEGAVCACPDGWDLINGKTCKSPFVSSSATHMNTTQSPPRASPSPTPPRKIYTPPSTTLSSLLSVINSTLGPTTEISSTLPVSLCNLLCMNGGTCSYSEEKQMDFCVCQKGYTGTYCNEEEPLEDLSRRSSHTHTSITVGVTLCCFLLLLLVVGVLGYMKYKRDNIQTVSEIVHFRPLLDKSNEEAEELVSDFPECISHRNRNQVYEEVSGIDSEDHGGLSWQYSTMSVDSAFISHADENDNLTSQLISTNQKA